MPKSTVKILFIIPSLVAHGAERQLCELLKHIDNNKFETHLLVYYHLSNTSSGELYSELKAAPHITLHYLHKIRGVFGYFLSFPLFLFFLFKLSPDIIHGYIDGNLLSLLAGKIARKPVVWGIRSSIENLPSARPLTKLLFKLQIFLSRFVDLAIFNSETGLRNYKTLGADFLKCHVIPNGFDVQRFYQNPFSGQALRKQWEIASEIRLIGMVGRFDPVKDHSTFLHAASMIATKFPKVGFVCVGGGPRDYINEMMNLAKKLGILDKTIWTGSYSDMPRVYNAFSVLVLTSISEGFPNVLGEAMACGVPCVSTHVGDASKLIGDTGFITQISDPLGIATSVLTLLNEPPPDQLKRSILARARICNEFSTYSLVQNTETVLSSLLTFSI